MTSIYRAHSLRKIQGLCDFSLAYYASGFADRPFTDEAVFFNCPRCIVGVEMANRKALSCTACRYCTSHYPQGLDIPHLLALYNEHRFTGGGFIVPMALSAIPADKQPNACIGCRSCEAVCPQQLKISEAMSASPPWYKGGFSINIQSVHLIMASVYLFIIMKSPRTDQP